MAMPGLMNDKDKKFLVACVLPFAQALRPELPWYILFFVQVLRLWLKLNKRLICRSMINIFQFQQFQQCTHPPECHLPSTNVSRTRVNHLPYLLSLPYKLCSINKIFSPDAFGQFCSY